MNKANNRLITQLFLLISLCFTLIACTKPTNSQSNTQTQTPIKSNQLTKLLTERNKITDIIRLQCDVAQQCENIGIGHMACGGFAKFLPYSTKSTDVTWLKKQVYQYNNNAKKSNQQKGAVGICQHITRPQTACFKNQCVNSPQLNML